MKIIIIENELYLAQSIATKLGESGYETEIYSSIKEAMKSSGDVYLLSTNLPGQNSAPLITQFSDKIVILMVSYSYYPTFMFFYKRLKKIISYISCYSL